MSEVKPTGQQLCGVGRSPDHSFQEYSSEDWLRRIRFLLSPSELGSFRHGRLTISRNLGKLCSLEGDSERGLAVFRPTIMIPAEDCIALCDKTSFEVALSWATEVHWHSSLYPVLADARPQPTIPLYRSDHISESVMLAKKTITEALTLPSGQTRRISGRDFERIVGDTLEFLGVNVQMNPRTPCGEIDLLLLHVTRDRGIESTVVECKHTKRGVSLSQVMRLYGLREALGRDLNIKNAILVTTSSCSSPARQATKILAMDVMNYEALMDWVNKQGLANQEKRYPLFRIANMDRYGRVCIPKCLSPYLDAESAIITAGITMLRAVEIRGLASWRRLMNTYHEKVEHADQSQKKPMI